MPVEVAAYGTEFAASGAVQLQCFAGGSFRFSAASVSDEPSLHPQQHSTFWQQEHPSGIKAATAGITHAHSIEKISIYTSFFKRFNSCMFKLIKSTIIVGCSIFKV